MEKITDHRLSPMTMLAFSLLFIVSGAIMVTGHSAPRIPSDAGDPVIVETGNYHTCIGTSSQRTITDTISNLASMSLVSPSQKSSYMPQPIVPQDLSSLTAARMQYQVTTTSLDPDDPATTTHTTGTFDTDGSTTKKVTIRYCADTSFASGSVTSFKLVHVSDYPIIAVRPAALTWSGVGLVLFGMVLFGLAWINRIIAKYWVPDTAIPDHRIPLTDDQRLVARRFDAVIAGDKELSKLQGRPWEIPDDWF